MPASARNALPGAFLCRLVQGIVQAFPVAAAVTSVFRRLHVNVGKVGRNGGCLSCGGRQRILGRNRRHVPPYCPPPVGVAGQRAQGGGRGLVNFAQQAFGRGWRNGGIAVFCKLPVACIAHVGQRSAQFGIAAKNAQGRKAALVHKALNRAQLVHSVKAGGHLGVALVQQRAPPHGKPVAAAEPVLHFAAVHGHAAHVVRPGHVLGADFL